MSMEQLIKVLLIAVPIAAAPNAGEFPPKNSGAAVTFFVPMTGLVFIAVDLIFLADSGPDRLRDALALRVLSLDTILIPFGYLAIILGMASRFGKKD